MAIKGIILGAILAGTAVTACSAAPADEVTEASQSALVIHPCVGLECRPLPPPCVAGNVCCAGSTCETNELGQPAVCNQSNVCQACGALGQIPCGGGQDCYGTEVLNAAGTCQSCSAVRPTFAVTVTGPTGAELKLDLAQAALGQLTVVNVYTGAVVAGWTEVFADNNPIVLTLQPEETYRAEFTPTASVTSTGTCAMSISGNFSTPPVCTIGAACQGSCTSCNDGTCQCSGTTTSCANAFAPVCTTPSSPCANHQGSAGTGCTQE